jgi:hypothetical protein
MGGEHRGGDFGAFGGAAIVSGLSGTFAPIPYKMLGRPIKGVRWKRLRFTISFEYSNISIHSV